VALDEDQELGVGLHRFRVRIENLGVFRADVVPVEVEADVLELRRRREFARIGSGGVALSVRAGRAAGGRRVAATVRGAARRPVSRRAVRRER